MNSSNLKWSDIISIVEKAHLEATQNLKVRERIINRKYVHEADEQIKRKKQLQSHQKAVEFQERLRLEQQIKRQEEDKRLTKQLKSQKEKQYSKDNFNIMLAFKSKETEPKDSPYSEHPFTTLVDQADRRRDHFKQKLRKQNQINSLQQKIKQRQKRQRKMDEMLQRQKYVNHVEAFYLKKLDDRNIFKNKYLKLSNPQKSQFLHAQNPFDSTIEKDYQTLNCQMMRAGKLKDPYVDDVLSSINRHIEIPDSSPAYLGRIPINTDRKRQLDYLQRSAHQTTIERARLKTQGDAFDSKQRRFTTETHELPMLENYYKHLGPTSQLKQKQRLQINKSPYIRYLKSIDDSSQTRNTTNQLRNGKYAANNKFSCNASLQNRSEKATKKVYSTYDIIQNKRKFVCI